MNRMDGHHPNTQVKTGPPSPVSVEELWHERNMVNEAPKPPSASLADLWDGETTTPASTTPPNEEILGTTESMAFKQSLQNRVEDRLKETDLTEIVGKVLEKVIPPIVERLVQERLDKLLQEQEQFVETKA